MRHPACLLATAAIFAMSCAAQAQTKQEHVHGHAHQVMPFEMDKTIHVFRMTESGGVQRVVTRSSAADAHQVSLIQDHLKHEAKRFQSGDFGDPAKLHGAAMPGLEQMRAAATRMNITYRPLPNGAQIEFRAKDIRAITAIHRWFGAQLSEHGADAKAE